MSFINIWGPPRKFSDRIDERKISWLELFFDLVYVLAISRITHHLTIHFNWHGLLDYIYIFGMIFWGWSNGSYHHDLHGNSGLRTNLMTLWQIMIIAALIVTLGSPPESLVFNATIVLIIMQVYITYLWWSVGIYDKAHRQLNKPYTVCFLISLAFLVMALFINIDHARTFYFISLALNMLPPFLLIKQSRRRGPSFSLSAGMTERLGLFTIILFGEVVAGIVYGASEYGKLTFGLWMTMILAMLIVFALWWIFFTMIADLRCTMGFFGSYVMILVYMPTLMALGMTGACFNDTIHFLDMNDTGSKAMLCISLFVFLTGVSVICYFLDFPAYLQSYKKWWRVLLIIAATALFASGYIFRNAGVMALFTCMLIILLVTIYFISKGRLAIPRTEQS
jgi:low temperature requirement protein LtrA